MPLRGFPGDFQNKLSDLFHTCLMSLAAPIASVAAMQQTKVEYFRGEG